jgi:hypothetical protein
LTYLSAGSSTPGYREWNVALDPNAFVRLLRSDLPIDIFPCATKDGPFAYDSHNSYWQLPDLHFIERMDPKLRRYLNYALDRVCQCDFLRAMDEDLSLVDSDKLYSHAHNVWETAVWMAATDRRLVRHRDGSFEIVPASGLLPSDTILPNRLVPIVPHVADDGTLTYTMSSSKSNFRIYERDDPTLNERALQQALPRLYLSFQP